MKKIACCLFALFILSPFELPADDEWTLLSKADGIETCRKVLPGTGLVSIKAAGEIDAPLEALRELSIDASSLSQWHRHCKECKLIKSSASRRDFIIYYVMDEGWPAPVRDFVAFLHVTSSSKDEFSGGIHALKNNSDSIVPLNDDYVRTSNMSLSWLMTRTGKNRTLVEFVMTSAPTRSFPWFFKKAISQDIPPKTIEGMRIIINKTDKYYLLAGITRDQ
jgi:hypothetical protein